MKQSISIPTDTINRILVFQDEKSLREALAANDQLQYLFGMEEIHRKNFPGVFIAGFKPSDNRERNF